MADSTIFYRVKVFVDGRWTRTGDFRDLKRAKDHARLIGLYLERQVEIYDQAGRRIDCEILPSMNLDDSTQTFTMDEYAPGSTLAFD